jgi:uncharacterized membrane protein
MHRAPQLAIILSAGALLFVAAQWPRYTIPACIMMFGVIWVSLRRIKRSDPAQPKQRNPWRRVAGFVIAALLLFWALLSLIRG